MSGSTEKLRAAAEAAMQKAYAPYSQFRVGAALKLEFGDAARSIWDGWSATSQKFDPRTQHTVWKSIRRGTGVTLGTVFHLARENGYREGRHA